MCCWYHSEGYDYVVHTQVQMIKVEVSLNVFTYILIAGESGGFSNTLESSARDLGFESGHEQK